MTKDDGFGFLCNGFDLYALFKNNDGSIEDKLLIRNSSYCGFSAPKKGTYSHQQIIGNNCMAEMYHDGRGGHYVDGVRDGALPSSRLYVHVEGGEVVSVSKHVEEKTIQREEAFEKKILGIFKRRHPKQPEPVFTSGLIISRELHEEFCTLVVRNASGDCDTHHRVDINSPKGQLRCGEFLVE